MHKHLVTDSFVSLVEQNYSPILKSHKKTSAWKEHLCFEILRPTSPLYNEQLAVNFLTCTSPAQRNFLPTSISCRCFRWGAARVAGCYWYPDRNLSFTGLSRIVAFYYTAFNPLKTNTKPFNVGLVLFLMKNPLDVNTSISESCTLEGKTKSSSMSLNGNP